ncbi:MAG: T9SS type A sorting domain-containing protein [bacterium]|nr:T9SS type A sorting domain-containing protein [bacterium]
MRTVLTTLFGVLILLVATATLIFAAEGDTLWTRYYGGEWYEMAFALCPTNDGGCVLGGYTQYDYAGPQNMYAVRVDGSGDTLWTGEYGSNMYEKAYGMCPAADGGYLLTGHTNEFTVWSDVDLVKINANGAAEWSHHYGGDMYETAYSICPAGDGYLLAGETGSFTTGGLHLVRINSVGGELWSYGYGGDVAQANCVIPAESGGFLAVGYTERYGTYNLDVYLLKVDDSGNTLWSLMFGGDQSEVATSVCPSGDGGFVVAGYTASEGAGSWDGYLIKVNDSGDTLWTKTYGNSLQQQFNAICPSGDGGFLLAGFTGLASSTYPDMLLIKVDALGNTLWTRTYGNEWEDEAHSICLSSDGAILLAGHSQPAPLTYFDMYLVKIDGSGSAVPPQDPLGQPTTFNLYPPHPNPFNPTTTLTFTLPHAATVSLEVFDINGRCVGVGLAPTRFQGARSAPLQETWYNAGTHTIPFDGSDLPSGIYFARLTAGDWSAVQKMVLLK